MIKLCKYYSAGFKLFIILVIFFIVGQVVIIEQTSERTALLVFIVRFFPALFLWIYPFWDEEMDSYQFMPFACFFTAAGFNISYDNLTTTIAFSTLAMSIPMIFKIIANYKNKDYENVISLKPSDATKLSGNIQLKEIVWDLVINVPNQKNCRENINTFFFGIVSIILQLILLSFVWVYYQSVILNIAFIIGVCLSIYAATIIKTSFPFNQARSCAKNLGFTLYPSKEGFPHMSGLLYVKNNEFYHIYYPDDCLTIFIRKL